MWAEVVCYYRLAPHLFVTVASPKRPVVITYRCFARNSISTLAKVVSSFRIPDRSSLVRSVPLVARLPPATANPGGNLINCFGRFL